MRALYATGFFSDIEMRRDGATLVIVVLERPSIESFEITGNKDIKTEDLQKSLRAVGLATGKTFDRSVLEEVRELHDRPVLQPRQVRRAHRTKVEEVPGNKVRIKIEIKEGKRARIRQINLVGNEAFDDEELLDAFELRTPNWLSWYKQDDRYSRESLQGDIETLQLVLQGPRLRQFRRRVDAGRDLAGEGRHLHHDEPARGRGLQGRRRQARRHDDGARGRAASACCWSQPGQVYSRKLITQTQELLALRLGEEGYAFAKIEPVPQANEETKTVDLTFFVDPGNRVYVRRINFINTTAIDDEVLRREMRQLEGAYLSNTLLERSKERLQRLPYMEKVEFETHAGAGHAGPGRRRFRHQGRPAGPVQRRHRLLRVADVHPERQLRAHELHGLRRARWRSSCSRAGTRSRTASRTPTRTRTIDGLSRTTGLPVPRHHAVRVGGVGLLDADDVGDAGVRLPDHRVPGRALRRHRADVRPDRQPAGQRARGASTGCRTNGNPYTRRIEREIPDGPMPAPIRTSSRRRCSAPNSTATSWSPAGTTTRATARSSRTAACAIRSAWR